MASLLTRRIVRVLATLLLTPLGGCVLSGNVAGADRDERPEPVSLRFNLAYVTPVEGARVVADENGWPLHIAPEPILTEDDIKSATVLQGARRSLVLLELTPMAAGRMDQISTAHVGDRLAVFIDDKLILSPWLKGAITRGRMIIDGGFSADRARKIAHGLNIHRPAAAGYRP